jgi:hypothetical protein
MKHYVKIVIFRRPRRCAISNYEGGHCSIVYTGGCIELGVESHVKQSAN